MTVVTPCISESAVEIKPTVADTIIDMTRVIPNVTSFGLNAIELMILLFIDIYYKST